MKKVLSDSFFFLNFQIRDKFEAKLFCGQYSFFDVFTSQCQFPSYIHCNITACSNKNLKTNLVGLVFDLSHFVSLEI